jgi:hypothetical protein
LGSAHSRAASLLFLHGKHYLNANLLNQVMAEKRRKLKETWDRVISMYEKDAPEQWEDLKKLWLNYQVSHIQNTGSLYKLNVTEPVGIF